ncbi:type II CRISPR RNA-guided endonuclease Cas9 [Helicobacter sp. 12S02232-10]|nr:type II CRISPR RNA-guided endonuclease Cas9 [Helicobacter sp. 12S02232-10]
MKILGLDIGITSIGWALIQADKTFKQNNQIIDCGVRLFTQAENPKNGESLALPRREARSARRIIKRRKARILQIKKLLCKHFGFEFEAFLPKEASLPRFFQTNKEFLSPWELRSLGLDRKLNDVEFGRVLLHIAKRRGYNDLSLVVSEKEEDKKSEKFILDSIQENKNQMQAKGYRTIGEMMFKEYYLKEVAKGLYENVRNRNKKDKQSDASKKTETKEEKKENYKRSVGRKELQEEIGHIFEAQRRFGNQKASATFQAAYEKIAFYQRELKSFENKLGSCEFYPEEKRASKCCYSAEEFINLTKIINTLKNLESKTGEVYPKEIIKEILDGAKKVKSGLSYKKLREILKLDEKIPFQDSKLDYIAKGKKVETAIFIKFEKYHRLKDYLQDLEAEFNSLDIKTLDNIIQIITFNKSPKDIKTKLSKQNISKSLQEKLIANTLGFNQSIRLSLKALDEILPLMREGKRYDEAIEETGLKMKKKNTKSILLPPLTETEFSDTLNPVVNRAIAQCRKVINAVIKKYGKVHKIHLEFTREIGKNFKDRSKILKEQQENYDRNQEALKICKEIGLAENGRNILKVKLWIRQDEFCVYSGKKIELIDLKDEKLLDIDHIYPLSRSLDDSQNNKVLVFRRINQGDKGNKTPYEWIGHDAKKWDELIKRINTMKKLPRSVKKKIVDKNFTDKKEGDRAEFLARNLNDTSYINRLISQYLASYLEFLPLDDAEDVTQKAGTKGSKKHVLTLGGSLTSLLRHYWGLDAKNRNTHLHHAQDALIIAFATDGNIQSFSKYLQSKEEEYKKKADSKEKAEDLKNSDNKTKKSLERPLENFNSEVQERINKIFVSKAPRRNVTGALHEQTIRSKEDYFKEYGGIEGVEKAIKLGKIRQIDQGIVDNDGMVRSDIFRSKDKGEYYVVPVYTYDVAIGKLPNKAIVSGKDKTGVIKDWIEMDDNYEFCFSLFKDDLVQIQTNKMPQSVYAYFVGTSSSTAGLTFRHHSNVLKEDEKDFFKADSASGFLLQSGIRKLKIFKKCVVSALGEISEARLEPREDVRLKTTKKKR